MNKKQKKKYYLDIWAATFTAALASAGFVWLITYPTKFTTIGMLTIFSTAVMASFLGAVLYRTFERSE